MTQVNIKRAYEPASPNDGYRIYVDRLWPRGLSHETFHYDLWDKAIAPSTELREWVHGRETDAPDPEKIWKEFERRYTAELHANPSYDALRKELESKEVITLLYSSHDTEHNNAVVLAGVLKTDMAKE